MMNKVLFFTLSFLAFAQFATAATYIVPSYVLDDDDDERFQGSVQSIKIVQSLSGTLSFAYCVLRAKDRAELECTALGREQGYTLEELKIAKRKWRNKEHLEHFVNVTSVVLSALIWRITGHIEKKVVLKQLPSMSIDMRGGAQWIAIHQPGTRMQQGAILGGGLALVKNFFFDSAEDYYEIMGEIYDRSSGVKRDSNNSGPAYLASERDDINELADGLSRALELLEEQ